MKQTLSIVLLALGCAACSGSDASPRVPTRAELEKICPELVLASTAECGAIAIKHCGDYESLAECPDSDAVRAECEAVRRREVEQCR
jgi:hypothetical protein